jgi:fumarate reductase subunit D
VIKAVIPSIVLCLIVALSLGVGLLDPRDNTLETFAKGVGMLGMLILALSLARDARRMERQSKD